MDNSQQNQITALKRRIDKLEDRMTHLENTLEPGGWISEAFERQSNEIDELRADMNAKFEAMNAKVEQLREETNGKLDTILRHLTGMGNNE